MPQGTRRLGSFFRLGTRQPLPPLQPQYLPRGRPTIARGSLNRRASRTPQGGGVLLETKQPGGGFLLPQADALHRHDRHRHLPLSLSSLSSRCCQPKPPLSLPLPPLQTSPHGRLSDRSGDGCERYCGDSTALSGSLRGVEQGTGSEEFSDQRAVPGFTV
jgi:hypothetical protein